MRSVWGESFFLSSHIENFGGGVRAMFVAAMIYGLSDNKLTKKSERTDKNAKRGKT
jgi:hypothetical protein